MTPPRIALATSVHPLALERDDAEQVATVRVDVTAPADAPVRPLNLALVIDRSGSMAGAKIETARAAAARVVEKLADDDVVTVVAFATEAEAIVRATRLRDGRQAALEKVRGIVTRDQTNVARALQLARAEMAPHVRPDRVSAVFLVTDGQASDGDQALALVPDFGRERVLLYAAGIGADYNHDYTARLCGKNRADHVDADKLDGMHAMFDEFLRRDGHLVSAGGRLVIDPAAGVRVKGVTSAEARGQPIPLDGGRAVAVRDLAPGGRQSFLVELFVTPSQVGSVKLADVRLDYDLPASGLTRQQAAGEVRVEVTGDPARAGSPNPEVVKVAGTHRAIRLSDKAEADIAGQNIPDAVEKLGRVTRELRKLGEVAMADEMEKKAQELAGASPDQLGLLAKQIGRGTTRLARGDLPGQGGGT